MRHTLLQSLATRLESDHRVQVSLNKSLGAGAFSVVFEGRLLDDNRACAVKILKEPIDPQSRTFQQEFAAAQEWLGVLGQLPNSLTLYRVLPPVTPQADGKGGSYFVTCWELAETTLREHQQEHYPRGMPRDVAFPLFRDIALGIDDFTTGRLVHRDIKDNNTFLVRQRAKLGDPASMRVVTSSLTNTLIQGTPDFIPPEGFDGKLSETADRYAFAVTMFSARTGRRPFTDGLDPYSPDFRLALQQRKQQLQVDFTGLDNDEQEFFLRLVAPDPRQRPPAKERLVDLWQDLRPRRSPIIISDPVKPVPPAPQPEREIPTEPFPKQQPSTMVNSIGMRFIQVPAGEFLMGSNEREEEKPIHRVIITRPFYLGIYPVTQAEYQAVMKSNPSHFKGDTRPVEQVSWNDATEYCRRLTALSAERENGLIYRLPTEAEWEYACRAGTTTKWCCGDEERLLSDYAWYSNNSGREIHPVGTKAANAWGLYDMHGNVWEWCQDGYDAQYYQTSPTQNPLQEKQTASRGLRGGGWFNNGESCRSAYRGRNEPGYRYGSLGFRVATGQQSSGSGA